MSKYIIGLTLAVAFLVAANAKAEMVTLAKSELVWGGPLSDGKLWVEATGTATGVDFTFYADPAKSFNLNGNKNAAYFYGVDGLFDLSGMSDDYNGMNGAGNGWWAKDGWELANAWEKNSPLPVNFSATYEDGKGWDDFYAALDNFKLGFHLGSDAKSAGIIFTFDQPPPATPEPATLALMGLGLVGVAIARRRMKK